jgi:hypothetical protein
VDGRALCLFEIVALGIVEDKAVFFLEWALGLGGVEL